MYPLNGNIVHFNVGANIPGVSTGPICHPGGMLCVMSVDGLLGTAWCLFPKFHASHDSTAHGVIWKKGAPLEGGNFASAFGLPGTSGSNPMLTHNPSCHPRVGALADV